MENTSEAGLSSNELYKEAQVARLSGACYHEWDALKVAVRQEQFEVLAGGDTFFTRWFIARGPLGPDASASPTTCIFFRGVMWRSAELDSFRVWQALSQSWPTAFLPDHVAPMHTGGVVQAHKGIADLSHELVAAIAPHLHHLGDGPLLLAGHSLGGSLAQLTALHLCATNRHPANQLHVHTYGSPPSFAASCGAFGSDVLSHLGVPGGHFRSWVLDHDPVPRAMLSSDPYYQLALKSNALRTALSVSERLFGGASRLTSRRFLFRTLGDTYLLSVAEPARAQQPLPEAAVEAALTLPLEELVAKPARLLQTVLDHNHKSYSHDLQTAAALRKSWEARHSYHTAP